MSRAKVSKAFRVLTSACLVIGILAGSPVGADTVQSATAQPKIMSVGEVIIQIPAGVKVPSDEKIKQAMDQAQSKEQRGSLHAEATTVIPVFWYEEESSWYDHWPWKKGGSASNNTSQTLEYQLSVKGSVGVSFKGSFPAKLAVGREYNLSASVDITHSVKVPISPQQKATIWGTADGDWHKGKVYFDYIVCTSRSCFYGQGKRENVRFFLPSAPLFDVTEVCRSCNPVSPGY